MCRVRLKSHLCLVEQACAKREAACFFSPLVTCKEDLCWCSRQIQGTSYDNMDSRLAPYNTKALGNAHACRKRAYNGAKKSLFRAHSLIQFAGPSGYILIRFCFLPCQTPLSTAYLFTNHPTCSLPGLPRGLELADRSNRRIRSAFILRRNEGFTNMAVPCRVDYRPWSCN